MSDPVAIIGAGPAGLAAALALAERGVACTVLDDNARPGGQYLRQLPPGFVRTHRIGQDKRASALLGAVSHPLVAYYPDTTAWAFPEPRTVAFAGPRTSGRLRASAVVIAAGAHDRPQPFPGWTLPGVITAGGCLNLIKGQGLVPAGDVVVAGNGALVLLTAAALVRAGARVRAVAEAGAPSRRMAAALVELLTRPDLLARGIAYRARVLRARTPVFERWSILRADGDAALERVVLAPIDTDGQPDRSRSRTVAATCLVVGYGLQPSTELTRIAGCDHVFEAQRGGWLPVRTAELETSVKGLYVAGETGGIGGGDIARAEGRFVGETIAHRLGHGPAPVRAERVRLDRFRAALERLYALPATLDLADPETVVCRCEEITRAELDACARREGPDLERIKVQTRLAMGRCQGRNCLAPTAEIVAAACGRAVDTIAWPRMRQPARPVPVSALLTEALGPAMSPDAPDAVTPAA